MSKLNEDEVEKLTIERLQQLGYQYLYGPDIAVDGSTPLRSSFEQIPLWTQVEQAINRLNPAVPLVARQDALKQLQQLHSSSLITQNELFHRCLTEGVRVSYQENGQTRGGLVWLLDFAEPDNNDFYVVNQFTIIEKGVNKRPDVLLFVNGFPLVVIELKNPAEPKATVQSAFRQIQTYKDKIPSLFTYNTLIVISDGLEAKMGSLSADFGRYMAWKSADGQTEASPLISQLETLIQGLLNPFTLLDFIRHFVVFEKSSYEDPHTKQITVQMVKKIAAYHQYYAVNKAVESTLRASNYAPAGLVVAENPEKRHLPSVQKQPKGDKKGGVVWHTQGSGKSLSMVFYASKIIQLLDNPTLVVITDRNDLDDQLFDTFAAAKQLLRQEPIQAENREHLKQLLKVASGGVVFTTIQKFQPETGNVFEQLSERTNIVVIADEAHRTQYGLHAKLVDEKDEQGEIIGQKTVYGFAKYMRDALPQATYLGFTGTPIEKTDVNTTKLFGHYIDIYDIAQAVEDGATVKIYYESRLAKVAISDTGRKLIEALDEELETNELAETQQAKNRWTQLEALIGSHDRLKQIAQDIVTHFEQRQAVFKGKGLIVAMSRRVAVALYDEIIKLKPEWHSDELTQGVIKVVMTASSADGPELSKHHTRKSERRLLSDRMKNPEDSLQLVIVRDMWLTGFDVPCLHTLYLDKPMQGHNLMQAIARVNRVYQDKPGGLIVDYLGIASNLRTALSFYADNGGQGDPFHIQEQAVAILLEKLEVVEQMFFGFNYKLYFQATTSQKLSLILGAQEHILGLENGKKRFIDEVTRLSQAFALATPHEEALRMRERVAFFQAVKARLLKFGRNGLSYSDEEMETAIRQVIDEALVSTPVVDIYSAAGIKKPDISILSPEFLAEIRGLEHKNIALEVLKRLLYDEIQVRLKKNLVQSKSLLESLENSIRQYHNKVLTAQEVIEELINLSREIKESDEEAHNLGLSEYEYAFYTAVANNKSAKELMEQKQLKALAVVLTEQVRKNASIDWTIKESVRAKLRVIVKRILNKYGYPPDMQLLATETVLKQAELLADELTSK